MRGGMCGGSLLLVCCAAARGSRRGRGAAAIPTPEELAYASPLEIAALARWRAALCAVPGSGRGARSERRHRTRAARSFPVGHVPRGLSLSPDGERLFVTNSWDDTVTGDRYTSARCHRHLGGGRRAIERGGGSSRQAAVCGRPHRQRRCRPGCANGRGGEDAGGGARRQLSYAASPMAAACMRRTSIPIPRRIAQPPESEITVIDRSGRGWSIAFALPDIAGVFHVAISRDGRLGVVAELHPKNLVPLAHLEHGGAFADTLTLFGADVGKPVEVPLDELERYCVAALRRCHLAGQVADLCQPRRFGLRAR